MFGLFKKKDSEANFIADADKLLMRASELECMLKITPLISQAFEKRYFSAAIYIIEKYTQWETDETMRGFRDIASKALEDRSNATHSGKKHPLNNEQDSVYNLPFPKELARVQRTRIHNYEEESPGLGVYAAYVSGIFTIGLYIYDLGLNSIPTNLTDDIFRKHLVNTTSEIVTAAKNKGVELEFSDPQMMNHNESALKYWMATFKKRGDYGVQTAFALTAHKNKFIKIRASFNVPAEGNARLMELIANQYLSLIL